MENAFRILGMVAKTPPLNHLNYEFDASQGDLAEVTLDREANVLLMDHHETPSSVAGRTPRRTDLFSIEGP